MSHDLSTNQKVAELEAALGRPLQLSDLLERRKVHAKAMPGPKKLSKVQLGDADAVILLTGSVNRSGLSKRVALAAARCGIKLAVATTRDGYMKIWCMHKNIATWGVKWKSAWYRRRGHKVLYLENGLLKQKSGLYIDHAGYFNDSSIVAEDQPDPTQTEIAGMMAHCKSVFPWSWFEGGDPDGPIMIACQTHNDASVRWHHFPGRGSFGEGSMKALLRLCGPLRDRKVIVRPHPGAKDRFEDQTSGFDWPSGWSVDQSDNVYETLRKCSGLVTVTSTLATEVQSLGIPVACLGQGAWMGSGAVLECAKQVDRVADVLNWKPDEYSVIKYLCSVMRHQLSFQASVDDILRNVSFRHWITDIGGKMPDVRTPAEMEVWIRKHGSGSDIVALDELLFRLKSCKGCRRQALIRSMNELASRSGSKRKEIQSHMSNKMCLQTYPPCPESVPDTLIIAAIWGRGEAHLNAIRTAFETTYAQRGDFSWLIIEAQFDEGGTAIPEIIAHSRVSHMFVRGSESNVGLFHKELLYNQAGSAALDMKRYKKFIFADLDFVADDDLEHFWKISCELDHDPSSVVHGMSTLGDTGEPDFHMTGYAYGKATGKPRFDAPGLVWGMTSDTFRARSGFNPWGVLTSGDVIFVLECGGKMQFKHGPWRGKVARAWLPDTPIRYVDVPVTHIFHGAHRSRRYAEKDTVLEHFGGDPRKVVKISKEGLLEWLPDAGDARVALSLLSSLKGARVVSDVLSEIYSDPVVHDLVLPSFAICGAMRCGTSACREILAGHPEIYIPRVREFKMHGWPWDCGSEVRFWDNWVNKGASLDDYAGLFGDTNGRIAGEHSPGYSRNHQALALMADVIPDVKIVLLFRNPAERTYSHWWHQSHVFPRKPWTTTPFQAVADRTAPASMMHWVDGANDYPSMLRHAWSAVGRDRVHVGIMERVRSDEPKHYNELARWLGCLSPFPDSSFGEVPGASFASGREDMDAESRLKLNAYHASMVSTLREMLGDAIEEWDI